MIFYCPNCWTRVKENEKVCHECKANMEPLDHRSYFEKLVNALNHSERTIPMNKRSTAYGIFNAGFGLFWFLGSALMGVLYDVSISSLVISSVVM